jgi:uncharacterized protein YcbK (DUF882 family)
MSDGSDLPGAGAPGGVPTDLGSSAPALPAGPSRSRRGLLAGLGSLALLGLLPRPALALVPARALTLHSPELGEKVRATYYENGRYDPAALAEIRRLFRDKHNGSEIDIDPDLLDLLWTIQRQLCPTTALDVVCGYRSPETNAALRLRSRAVAANSFHMYGKAVDLRIPGCPVSTLHRFAINLEAGGVGYYPRSNFVHIDTGPVRRWGQGGRVVSGRSSRTPLKKTSLKGGSSRASGKRVKVSLKTKN